MGNVKSLDLLQLGCLFMLALALIPAGAHLFELPNKMALPPDQYMTVQNIYRGWALFGIAIFGALLLTLAHAVAVRGNATSMLLSLIAALCIGVGLAVFFAFTYPMNVATANWTVTPLDFEHARRQWEYSHALNAVLMLAAFAALTLSVLTSRSSLEAA